MIRGTSLSSEKPYDGPPSVILNIEALEKRGKTRLALSAPGPIAYLNLDRKADYLINLAKKEGKKITKKDYHYRPAVPLLRQSAGKDVDGLVNAVAGEARPVWKRLEKDFIDFLDDAKIRTIILDNSSLFYRLARWAKFGKLSEVPPYMYQKLNADLLWWFTVGRDHPEKNFIYIHRLTDEWVNVKKEGAKNRVGEKTGKFVRDGWKDAGFEVDATIRLDKEVEKGKSTFIARITDSGMAGLDEEFEGEDITFPNICAAIFEDTRPKDWTR